MIIQNIKIESFRNLTQVELDFSSKFNIFYGVNGSGKTSLLEAIYYLSFGRSFRSHLNNRIIQHEKDKLLIFSQTDEHKIGLERSAKEIRIRLDDNDMKSIASIASVLPLQIIHAHTHELLEAGPEIRRQFLDWGMFHVEHNFIHNWRRYMKALKQRNAALKANSRKEEITVWNKELLEAGNLLNQSRQSYLNEFLPIFNEMINKILAITGIELNYYQGWNREKSLEEAIIANFDSDKDMSFTQLGPHRADLKITIDKIPAKDRLSRGQQKLFVSAMQLAQGTLLQAKMNKKPVFLIDDIAAELDQGKKSLLLQLLQQIDAQIFITCIDSQELRELNASEIKLFHVEHGKIKHVEGINRL